MWRRFVLAGVPIFLLGRDLLQTLDLQLHPSFALTITGVCVTSEAQEPDLKIPKPLEVVPREKQSIGN